METRENGLKYKMEYRKKNELFKELLLVFHQLYTDTDIIHTHIYYTCIHVYYT